MHARTLLPALLAAALLLAGCREVREVIRPAATPHEQYAETLREAGLRETALGRAWFTASRQALRDPLVVEPPFREVGYLDPSRPSAVGYRIGVERGQELRVHVAGADSLRLFVDLFEAPEDTSEAPEHVASADTTGRLVVEASGGGAYLLRLQPELLQGGRYTLTIEAGASLVFPVAGRDTRSVRSFFGDARDGGAREHHGVDIFADRGTPVVAAASGYARADRNNLGGRVVWLRDRQHGRAFYYAHLDSQLITSARVEAGDTLGLVGNTGNARTTPPHLHFGIYQDGPVDPYPFVHEPRSEPAPLTADTSRLGGWARVAVARANLRGGPTTEAPIRRTLGRHTALRLAGSSSAWHRVRLPDGTPGFIAAHLTGPAAEPLRAAAPAAGQVVRHRPALASAAVDSLRPQERVPVLGRFGAFLFVETPRGRTGWIAAGD